MIYNFPWSKEEDLILCTIISKQRGSSNKLRWTQISQELQIQTKTKQTRLPRQCRERWINHLNQNINKMPWTQLERNQLLDYVQELGNKWSLIGKILNRNENQVRNIYNGIIKKNQSSKKSQDKINSINSSILMQQQCPPDITLDYEFGFANLQTKEVYICDKNQFLMLFDKKKDSLQHTQTNFVSFEQDIYFSPFNSGIYYANEYKCLQKD